MKKVKSKSIKKATTSLSKSLKSQHRKESSISTSTSFIIKIGKRHRCPNCKRIKLEEYLDGELLLCSACGWSLNLRIIAQICASEILIRIQKGFKRMFKCLRRTVEQTGESFQKIGEAIDELSEMIKEEERKKKEIEKKL